MKIFVEKDYKNLSLRAALLVAERIRKKPNLVLGLPTGRTPLGMYRVLVKMYKEGKIDFSKVCTFNLDEYVGLSPSDPNSYHFYMKKNFFSKINIDMKNTFFPTDFKGFKEFEEKIKTLGGIDLQILGIGRNGHIGFNEPGSSFKSKTRIVFLSEQTRKDNSKYFKSPNKVPKMAVTMGISTIMSAKEILLLASGSEKKEIIKEAILGKVTQRVPASILQKHKNCIVILDKKAAQLILK